VVPDHPFEKEAVDLGPFEPGEVRHLFGGQHTGHHHRGPVVHAGHVHHMRVGSGLAPRFQPPLHHLDLVGLRHLDAQRQLPHVGAGGSRGEERGHLQRLRVVMNHALHEFHVRRRVVRLRKIAGLAGRDDAARLAGRSRLHDRWLGLDGGAATRGDSQRGDQCQDVPGRGEIHCLLKLFTLTGARGCVKLTAGHSSIYDTPEDGPSHADRTRENAGG
jgi:hypothetical protein